MQTGLFHYSIKSGKKGTAKEHATYIARQGKYVGRIDLVYTECGNLPDWAEGNSDTFWKAADTYERANAAAYREHEISLPNELSVEQNQALAITIARELAGKKPFQLAVHAPVGSLSGIANPHMHLMLSDRMPDGFSRPAEQWFSRRNPTHPEVGGCRKESGGKRPYELRDAIIATRKKIAKIQNEVLAEHGHDVRVDHRSLCEQGIRRKAERYLGPTRIKNMSDEEKAAYAEARLLRHGT